MQVEQIRTDSLAQGQRLSAIVQTKKGLRQEVFCTSGDLDRDFSTLGNSLAAALFVSAMSQAEDLHIEGPVSRRLMENLGRVQESFARWYPDLTPIEITAAEPYEGPTGDEPTGSRAVGCSFSGGVDSWFSYLRHRQEVSRLLLVRGFDISLRGDRIWNLVRSRLRGTAEQLDCRLLAVETNFRQVAERIAKYRRPKLKLSLWGDALFIAELAAVWMTLQNEVEKAYLPSSGGLAENAVYPHASTPENDRLFTFDNLELVPDGWDHGRVEKIVRVAREPIVLQNLRVCYENTFYNIPCYNCCRCRKCLQVMVTLRCLGKLEGAMAFDRPLELSRLLSITSSSPAVIDFWRQTRDLAVTVGDEELIDIIEQLLGERVSFQRYCALKMARLGNLKPIRSIKKYYYRWAA